MRVLVVHNRYRIQGGEERSVELQLEALRHAGIADVFERDAEGFYRMRSSHAN